MTASIKRRVPPWAAISSARRWVASRTRSRRRMVSLRDMTSVHSWAAMGLTGGSSPPSSVRPRVQSVCGCTRLGEARCHAVKVPPADGGSPDPRKWNGGSGLSYRRPFTGLRIPVCLRNPATRGVLAAESPGSVREERRRAEFEVGCGAVDGSTKSHMSVVCRCRAAFRAKSAHATHAGRRQGGECPRVVLYASTLVPVPKASLGCRLGRVEIELAIAGVISVARYPRSGPMAGELP